MTLRSRARAQYEYTAEDKTKAATKSVRDGAKSVQRGFSNLQKTLLSVAGAAGFGAVVKASLDAADALGKNADAVGLTTDEYQELAFTADKAGISQGQFTSNMTAFIKRVGEARQGTGALNSFLAKYDETLLQSILDTNSQAEAFELVADAIANATTATDKAAIANAAFSRAGVSMVNMMRDGAAGMEEWREQARELGIVIDESLIRQAEAANDQLSVLGQIIRNRVTGAVVELAPEINELATAFTEALPSIVAFTKELFGVESASDQLLNEISELVEQRDRLIAMSEQRQGGIRRWASDLLGLETPEELGKRLDQITATIMAKRAELNDLLQQQREDRNAARAGAADDAGSGAAAVLGTTVEEIDTELTRQFEALTRGLMTEEQLIADSFLQRQFIIEQAFEEGIIPTTQRYYEVLAANEANFQGELNRITEQGLTDREKFQKQSGKDQAKQIFGDLTTITQGVANHNKTIFRLNQASGIANAIINTYEGVSKTLATYPWPIAGVLAAAHLAAGLAQVSAIRSATFDDRNAAPSLAGGGAVAAPVPTIATGAIPSAQAGEALGPQTIVQVNISGQPSAQDIRDMIEQINEQTGDGVELIATVSA